MQEDANGNMVCDSFTYTKEQGTRTVQHYIVELARLCEENGALDLKKRYALFAWCAGTAMDKDMDWIREALRDNKDFRSLVLTGAGTADMMMRLGLFPGVAAVAMDDVKNLPETDERSSDG